MDSSIECKRASDDHMSRHAEETPSYYDNPQSCFSPIAANSRPIVNTKFREKMAATGSKRRIKIVKNAFPVYRPPVPPALINVGVYPPPSVQPLNSNHSNNNGTPSNSGGVSNLLVTKDNLI